MGIAIGVKVAIPSLRNFYHILSFYALSGGVPNKILLLAQSQTIWATSYLGWLRHWPYLEHMEFPLTFEKQQNLK